MKLMKYQRGYLGDADATLTERATQRCGGTIIPYPNFTLGSSDNALASDNGRKNPRVADLDDTRGIVFYSTAGNSTVLYYRVITVADDGTVSWGSEQTLLSSIGFLTSWGVCNIYDNKVLVVYKHTSGGSNTYCDVGTVDGAGAMTFATPTVVGTTHTPDIQRSWFELVKVEDGRAVLASKNTDNSKNGLQVIDVDVSDNITYGTVAKSTQNSKATPKVAMLSTSAGIITSGGLSVNTLAYTEKFTISGTTITLDGTEYLFTNNTQYPVENDQFYIGDSVAVSSSRQSLVGSASIASSRYPLNHMSVTDTSGVLTSSEVLEDLTSVQYASSPTTVTMSCYHKGSSVYVLAITDVSSTYELSFIRHTDADPPSYVTHSLVAQDVLVETPDSTLVGTKYGINVWGQNDGVNSWIAVNGVYFDPRA